MKDARREFSDDYFFPSCVAATSRRDGPSIALNADTQFTQEDMDSDEEFMAALEAEMEDRSRPKTGGACSCNSSGGGSSSSSINHSLPTHSLPSASDIAEQIHRSAQWEEWEAAAAPAASATAEVRESAPAAALVAPSHVALPQPLQPGSSSTQGAPCRLFDLPEELQRRVLRIVSIANLVTGVRCVSKHARQMALAEVRERIRGMLYDALVSGFETEMAVAAAVEVGGGGGKAPMTPLLGPQPAADSSSPLARTSPLEDGLTPIGAAPIGAVPIGAAPRSVNYVRASAAVSESDPGAASGAASSSTYAYGSAAESSTSTAVSSSSSSSSSSSAATAPPVPRREKLPAQQRLLALSAEVQVELTSLAASKEVPSERVRTLTSKTRSICFNLSDAKNPELRSRLLVGDLSPSALVRLSSQEMASGSLRAQRVEWKANRLKCAIRPERHLGFQTDVYKCEGCGSRTTRVHRTIRAGQQQVDRNRTYVTCVDCGRRWEEGGM